MILDAFLVVLSGILIMAIRDYVREGRDNAERIGMSLAVIMCCYALWVSL
jgi:hypothetical protein